MYLNWKDISGTNDCMFTAGSFILHDGTVISTMIRVDTRSGWATWSIDKQPAVDSFEDWISDRVNDLERAKANVATILEVLAVRTVTHCAKCGTAIYYEDQIGEGPGEWLSVNDPKCVDDSDLSMCSYGVTVNPSSYRGQHYPNAAGLSHYVNSET